MFNFKFAIALGFSAFALIGCSASSDGNTGEIPGSRVSQDALKGGCRVVCPKCHPGEVCPKYMCRLDCPPGVTPCGDTVCRHGQECCNASCGTCVDPGTMCSQIACDGSGTCVQTAMCMIGYEWSTTQCQCVPSAPAPGACASDADCRLVDDYCTGCDCRSLSTTDADPVCDGPGVRCFAEPCLNHTAACVGGQCVVQ
jgi:hypothetical protein